MAHGGNRHGNVGEDLECLRVRDDLGLDPSSREDQVDDHSNAIRIRTDQPNGREPAHGILLHKSTETVASRSERPDQLLGVTIALDEYSNIDITGKPRLSPG